MVGTTGARAVEDGRNEDGGVEVYLGDEMIFVGYFRRRILFQF